MADWEISLGQNIPLIVTTGNLERIFPSRRGSYLVIEASDEKKSYRGIGELVEPVFTLPDEDPATILVQAREVLRNSIDMLRGDTIGIEWKTDIERLISSAFARANIGSRMTIRIARFSLEQSLLTMVADVMGKPLWWVLRGYLNVSHPSGDLEADPVVRLNFMFNLRQGADLDQIPNGVVKLKVGGPLSHPQADAIRVSHVAERLKEGQTLRLDANQSWSCDDYTSFIQHLSPDVVAKIEYIEEPLRVACTDELRKCLASCPSSMVVALDESLLYKGIESILVEYRNLKVVNKVFLHGLKDSGQDFLSPTRTTFTCTFESGVGLAFLVSLAYAVNPTQYHGLHHLQQMVRECPITRTFSELIKNDEDGFFVNVHDVESVLRNFSFSI